jgi:hypothetical protein
LWESVFVRDYRGIGRMGVTCKVGIVDYLLCDECERGRGSVVKVRVRRGGKVKERRREWKKREQYIGGEKIKWGKRGLSILLFGQNGRGK